MARILVTGGCGFIGSNFVRHLLNAAPTCEIINLDALTYAGNPHNLSDLAHEPRYRFELGDITDSDALTPIFDQGIDAVVHFAAESHVDRSLCDGESFVRTNVLGTQLLVEQSRRSGVSRFLHVSTDEVYGSLGSTGLFTEDSPLAPNNPYAASKASADLLVRSYVQSYQFPAIITRCSNNYGPYQFPEKLIPRFLRNLLRDEPVPVYGDGLQIRDWLHVSDHCRALEQILHRGRLGEVYNIGGRCERTNLEVTHQLVDMLDKPRSLIRFVRDRLGHDRRYGIDCSKLERELGWHAQVSFETGLEQTVGWYRENAGWMESILRGDYRRDFQARWVPSEVDPGCLIADR